MSGVEHKNVVLILARQLAANAAVPMLLVDTSGSVVYCNEQALQLLGRSIVRREGPLDGRWDTTWEPTPLSPGPSPSWVDPTRVALRTEEPVHDVVCVKDHGGIERTVSVSAFPLFCRPDELVGALAFAWRRDTT